MPWVLLENVTGLLKWHLSGDSTQSPAIAHVVGELESLGYRWAHWVINLPEFGLPQQRRRVFILASLHGDPRDVLLSSESICCGQCVDMEHDTQNGSVKVCERGMPLLARTNDTSLAWHVRANLIPRVKQVIEGHTAAQCRGAIRMCGFVLSRGAVKPHSHSLKEKKTVSAWNVKNKKCHLS